MFYYLQWRKKENENCAGKFSGNTIVLRSLKNLLNFVHAVGEDTVKLANSASPFKFRQVKFPQQAGLENNKICFSQTCQ